MDGAPVGAERVLIIGWGFLGSNLGLRLAFHGADVLGLTRSETHRTWSARAQGLRIDIGDARDQAALARAASGVTQVVVAGGGLPPANAAQSPLLDATDALTSIVSALEEVRHHAGVVLTYLSSGGTVYGDPAHLPVHETDALQPKSPYGASRVAAEIYIRAYARAYGVPVRIIRCANVYGPDQPTDRNQGAVAIFLKRVSAGEPVMVIGDGSARRDYVYVEDVVEAAARLLLRRIAVDTVNVGSGEGHSVMQLLEAVSRVVGQTPVLDFQPPRRFDVGDIVLDITRIKSLIPYTPMSLDDGLNRTWLALMREGSKPSSVMLPRS
jgi:UDP-glucose 4-epimerase